MYLKRNEHTSLPTRKTFKGTKKEVTNLQLFVGQQLLKSNKNFHRFLANPFFFRSCYIWPKGEKNAKVIEKRMFDHQHDQK